MPITWKLQITRITIPKGDKSIVQTEQFEADTIGEAEEKADDIFISLIEQENPSPIGGVETGDLVWKIDNEGNFITKLYYPIKTLITGGSIKTQHLHEYHTKIEPIGISLSDISDYAETQQV